MGTRKRMEVLKWGSGGHIWPRVSVLIRKRKHAAVMANIVTLGSDARLRLRILIAPLTLLLLVYPVTNLLAYSRADTFVLATPWDSGLPLLPYMSAAYLSIFLCAALAVSSLRLGELRVLAGRCNAAIALAGLAFLAMPTRVAFAWPNGLHGDPLLWFIKWIDLPCNGFPSLHVSLATLLALTLARSIPSRRILFLSWLALVIASVLFTHQHYLIDVIGGLALAGSLYAVPHQAALQLCLSFDTFSKPTEHARFPMLGA